MEYRAYIKQSGEGCDYTIGCAQTLIKIEASNIIEAHEILYDQIKESYIGDRELELCELYEINQVVICDLEKIYKAIDNEDSNYLLELEENRELAEFERLKNKFQHRL